MVKTIYDFNSIYRGEELESIIAIGLVNKQGITNKAESYFPFELLSIFLSLFAKLTRYFKLLFFPKQRKKIKVDFKKK